MFEHQLFLDCVPSKLVGDNLDSTQTEERVQVSTVAYHLAAMAERDNATAATPQLGKSNCFSWETQANKILNLQILFSRYNLCSSLFCCHCAGLLPKKKKKKKKKKKRKKKKKDEWTVFDGSESRGCPVRFCSEWPQHPCVWKVRPTRVPNSTASTRVSCHTLFSNQSFKFRVSSREGQAKMRHSDGSAAGNEGALVGARAQQRRTRRTQYGQPCSTFDPALQ